ncbi:putative PEP-binding protein [Baaleninema sp.]|uniref:putative PEP-binding protein n=1 Tax=Baaleninema sp. TaxID=3101197 RepID=UPI003D01DF1D
MPEEVFPIDRAGSIECPWSGERGFYLGRLAPKNYPVLWGIVVSSRVFREFWQNNTWENPLLAEISHTALHLQADDAQQLQAIARQIREALLTAELPTPGFDRLLEAVSSLSTSGIVLHPSLYIEGEGDTSDYADSLESQTSPNDPASVVLALKRTWAELFRARSLLCWQQSNISLDRLYLSVLLQPLDRVLATGFLRSDRTHFHIAATSGRFDSFVEGVVIPDLYRIDAAGHTVVNHQSGVRLCKYDLDPATAEVRVVGIPPERQQDPVLDAEQLKTLLHWGRKLQTEFVRPFSVQWEFVATENGTEFYLSQVYPDERLWRDDWTIAASPASTPQPLSDDSPPPTSTDAPLATSPPLTLWGLPASSGQAIAPLFVVRSDRKDTITPPLDRILVVSSLEPTDFSLLKHAVGLVMETGSLTSHGAILARELGIPAVVGVSEATQQLQTGQSMRLDGDRGELTSNPDTAETKTPKPSLGSWEGTSEVRGTQLTVMVSQPSSLTAEMRSAEAIALADGIGLIRSELMAVEVLEGRTPTDWVRNGRTTELVDRLTEGLLQFTRTVAPYPVYYRTFDGTTGSPLGVRGTFAYTQDSHAFDCELAALKRVRDAGYANLHLVLPFVRSLEEFEFCRQRCYRLGLTEQPSFECWLMAEVPSVLFLLEDYVAAGVSGIAIGTNDLTQLLLGFDRENSSMAQSFELRHPAVLQAIAQLAKAARRLGIPCNVCIDTVSVRPELIDRLVRCGVTGISVRPDAIARSHAAILRAERRLLLDLARERLQL